MNIDDAAKLWAKMFFEDKYGDKVRVVQIKNTQIPPELQNDDIPEYFASFGDFLSVELCWWTHVANTKDIWCFTIVWQEAVASGIKRITALTGPRVSDKIHEVQNILDITINKLWIKTATQLQDKIDKVLKENEEMQEGIQNYQEYKIKDELQKEKIKINWLFDIIVKVPVNLNFKTSVAISRWLYKWKSVLICNQDWSFAIISSWLNSAKKIAQEALLKWWGNEDLVQGKDESVIDIYNKASFYESSHTKIINLAYASSFDKKDESASSSTLPI